MQSCGLEVPASRIVTSLAELDGVSGPVVVLLAFTLGGHGGGFAETAEERAQVERGLAESPIGQVLVEDARPVAHCEDRTERTGDSAI